jgi:hypothetical protein
MDDIRDVKPPIETPLWVWLLIALAVCAVAAAIYVFLRNRKKTIPAVIRPAWDTAFARLNDLSGKQYPQKGMFKSFYSELSAIVRHYLEDRFQINAPEMTTEEFLNYVKSTASLTDEQKKALKDFLNGSDMVKFAKHEPSVSEAQANFDLAHKLVVETKIEHGI